LTREEYEIIKQHAIAGGDLVQNNASLRTLAPIIRHHHEFYNGAGYPDQLAGNQISIEARIISVADAIEAMTSDRPYQKALKLEQVMDELQKYSGTQFDPLVTKAAIDLLQATIAGQNAPSSSAETPKQMSQLSVNIQVT
jgi:HD-GYP domain-containing protein (c-di-GMP phosphodiesterase class II)